MGVGSVGKYLLPYEECDTFLSTDAGVSWKMIRMDAHKYEFGDQGSILVVINDEEFTDTVRYSTDLGRTWCVPSTPPSPSFLLVYLSCIYSFSSSTIDAGNHWISE